MAENTIDSLDIQVSSTTTKAVKALENLQKSLGGINTAFRQLNNTGIRTYTKDVNKLTASLNALSHLKINMSKISSLNTQLQQLSNIDLKNLQNKKISLDIEVTGGDAQKKLRASLEQALRETKVDTSAIAQNLADSFNVTSKVAVNQMKSILDDMALSLSKTWDGQKVNFTKDNKFMDGLDELGRVVADNAKVIQSKMGIYDQFFAYFKNKKIYISDALKDAMGKDLYDSIRKSNIGQIVRDATKGIDISSIWDEMADLFPEHISRDVTNQVDQIVTAFDVLKRAREDIEHTISFKDLSAENQADLTDEIYGKIVESAGKMPEVIQSNIQRAIETASQQVDLDININEEKIINDIRHAIANASKVTYDAVKIKLDVNADGIKDEISKKIKNLSQGNIPAVTEAMKEFANTMTALNNVNMDDTGINKVTNALTRLLKVDMSTFDSSSFVNIVQSISSLATIPDVSASLGRFVSSLSRLASAGVKVGETANALPELGTALHQITREMSGLSAINDSVNMFVQSLGRLASAGKKTGETAGHLKDLSDEVIEFFKSMQKAPYISENTIRMTEALSRLATAGGNVNKSTNTVSQAMNKLSKNSSKIGGNIKKASQKIVSAFKNIGNATPHLTKANNGIMTLLKSVSLMGIMYKAFDWAREAVTLGSDITEVGNVVKVTFGDMANDVYAFASTAKQQFGLSQLAAQQYAGTMQGMLTSAKIATKTASDMSITLAGLAGDYASFWNVSTDEAFTAIRSGLAGETEPLRRFGKDMTVATLEAYALSQGITKAYTSMTQSEKILLRYNYLISASGNEMGDFAKNINTFANQWRVLTQNIRDLGTYAGQGLIAALLPVVQVLNVLMVRLIQVAKTFRNFMYTLTGYKGEGAQGGIVNDLGAIGDAYDDVASIGGAGDTAADGLDNASSAASELKKALTVLPFDQLNQLASAAEDASSGLGNVSSGVGGIGSVGDLGLGEIETEVMDLDPSGLVEEIHQWADAIRKAFIHQQWDQLGYVIATGINDGLNYLYNIISWKNVGPHITEFIHAFTTTFNSLVDWLDWDRMGRIIGAGITTIIRSLNLLLTRIDWIALGNGFATKLMGIVDEVDWAEFGDLIGNGLNSVMKTIYGFFNGLNPEVLGAEAARFLKHAFNKIDWDLLSKTVTSGINTVFGALSSFIDDFPFVGIALKLSSFLNDTITGIDWNNIGATIGNLFKGKMQAINTFLEQTDFDAVGTAVGEFLEGVDWEGVIRSVGKLIWNALKAAIEFYKGTFTAAPIETTIITVLGLLKFTGLGSKLGSALWTKLAEVVLAPAMTLLFGNKVSSSVKSAIETSVENGINASDLSSSSGLVQKLLTSSFGKLGGSIILAVELTHEIAQLTEVIQGGNGILTDMGAALHDVSAKMYNAKAITEEEKKALDSIIESMEVSSMSAEDMASTFIIELEKAGISADTFTAFISDAGYQASKTATDLEILANEATALGEGFSESASMINLSVVPVDEAFKNLRIAMQDLSRDNLNVSENLMNLQYILDQYATSSAPNAQAALDALIKEFEDAGLPVEDFINLLGESMPEALIAIEETTETSMANTEESVKTHMENASSSVSSSSSQMVKNASDNFAKVAKDAENEFGNVESTSDSKWSAADLSVEDALKLMQSASSEKMRAIYKNVESYTNSIYNITTNNWSALSLRVGQLMDEMNTSIGEKLETTKSLFDNFGNDIAGRMNLFWAGRDAIQSFVDGFRSMYIPTPHFRISSWRQHNLPNGGMMQSPIFEVNWYKDGGLFGNPSVIGVGEAGREAVLPLENRRTMRMIAESIVSNAGAGFMDEATMINAVAAGVSMAMSGMSFGDAPQSDVVVMIDGREVARAVNRANERSGYRLNP